MSGIPTSSSITTSNNDLENAADYIAMDSPYYAGALVNEAKEAAGEVSGEKSGLRNLEKIKSTKFRADLGKIW